jgi:hypothetical protein
VPSSQALLKTEYRMSNTYFRCQSPSLSSQELKVLKC